MGASGMHRYVLGMQNKRALWKLQGIEDSIIADTGLYRYIYMFNTVHACKAVLACKSSRHKI